MNQDVTVLIVDDEPAGRATLRALLLDQGYQLAFACSGGEALEQASKLTPDVILLDIMLPEMDGFQVCRRLRDNPQLAEVPVIIVTALDDRQSRLQGIAAGADDFISKPFDRAELRTRIKTIVQLNRFRQLHSERAKFEWVVENADEGYLVLNDQEELTYANAKAHHYLGLPANGSSLSPEPFLALVKRHYRLRPQDAWSNWPEQPANGLPRYLVQPTSATSDAFWLQVDLLKTGDGPTAIRLVRLRDITTSMIEHRMRWTFHGQVSHKLRTPLTLIEGFIEALVEYGPTISEAERSMVLSKAQTIAISFRKDIMEIFRYLDTNDVLLYNWDTCKFDEVGTVIKKLSSELNLNQPDLIFDTTAEPGRELCLCLPRDAMELIFWELFTNAQKFHPDQSPSLSIDFSNTDGNARIRIIDNGLRLSPEQLTKIWTPYYQAERGFSGQVPGMGLGLSIVASVVWSVGGTCRAYNRRDQPGVVIEITIPLAEDCTGRIKSDKFSELFDEAVDLSG